MCIHISGVPESMCTRCTPRRNVEQRASPPPTRSSNELIRYEFVDRERRLLSLAPDLQRGWKPHTKVSCFFEWITIDSLAECGLKIYIVLFPRASSGHSTDWPSLPELGDASSRTHRRAYRRRPRDWSPVVWDVSGGLLTIQVPIVGADAGLNPDLPWKQLRSQKLELRLVEYDLHASPAIDQIWDLRFELQLRVVAEPRPPRHRVERDWYRRFCPGGLPSLGKRA
jgi:hypothetical protein